MLKEMMSARSRQRSFLSWLEPHVTGRDGSVSWSASTSDPIRGRASGEEDWHSLRNPQMITEGWLMLFSAIFRVSRSWRARKTGSLRLQRLGMSDEQVESARIVQDHLLELLEIRPVAPDVARRVDGDFYGLPAARKVRGKKERPVGKRAEMLCVRRLAI